MAATVRTETKVEYLCFNAQILWKRFVLNKERFEGSSQFCNHTTDILNIKRKFGKFIIQTFFT
jgi:hypothetical protein